MAKSLADVISVVSRHLAPACLFLFPLTFSLDDEISGGDMSFGGYACVNTPMPDNDRVLIRLPLFA